MDQKPQKSQEGTINHTNIAWVSMLAWLIVPFYDFGESATTGADFPNEMV